MMMGKMAWIGLFLVLILFIFSGNYLMSAQRVLTKKNMEEQKKKQIDEKFYHSENINAHQEYILEIIGLGVTLDKYRQEKLWEILQRGNSYESVRESDPKKYAWTDMDKIGISGGRVCDAFENGVKLSPKYWGAPSFYASSENMNANMQYDQSNPVMGVAGSTQSTGMAWHLLINGPWLLDERPDHLLEKIFEFFDQHPDVPYIVLSAADGMAARNSLKAHGSPMLVRTGHYVPEMPDSAAVFVLARRERVEPLRNFIWDDPENNFVQEEFRAMYYELMAKLPSKFEFSPGVPIPRPPTVAEWLPAAAAFAKNPEIHPEGHRKFLINFKPYQNSPPTMWKPTPWFPIPWNREQMAAFDALPTLGFLHRPVFVKFVDDQGHPIKHREQRQQVLDAGWKQALLTLPESERKRGPARIIAGTNNNTEQLLALETLLHQYAADGGPAIDTGKTAQFINTDRRLGNTGAATLFVQMALGVMGSYREGGGSAAINLRDPNEASIVFISPPPDEKRKAQGEQFEHRVQPAIDPQNYVAPSPEALLDAQRRRAASATK